jgi:hypothetical protein
MQVKQEYKEHKYANEKMLSPGSARQSPVSDVEDVKPLSGSLLTSDDINVVAHNSRSNIQDTTYVQSTVLVTRKSSTKSRRSHSYTACLDTTQNTNVPNMQRRIDYMNANISSNILYGGAAGNIKMEPGISRFICLDKQSSVLHYFGDDDGIVAAGIKTQDRWPLKRIYSEEDLLHTKKRSGEAYPSTSTSDKHQDYGSSLATESEYPRAIEFNNQCNDTDARQLATTKSSELNSSESGNYQQLMEPATTSLEGTNPELGLLDLADLKEDLLLSSDLEADPGILAKIVRSFVVNVVLSFK